MSKKKRNDVNYMEFRDGYVLVDEADLECVIDAYKRRELRRNELRVFAARCEREGLHGKSKVDLARIVNCKSGVRGIRRLSAGEIDRAEGKLRDALEKLRTDESRRRIAVSRKMLRHAARGGGTSNEIIVMLFYCMRRIRQRRRLDRLQEHERYARFTYRELEALSGIPRANVCRAVSRLRSRGILNTAWVRKQNENQFGLLFVDGPLVSLTCTRQGASRAKRPATAAHEHKTTTASARIDNAPEHKTTTLKNDNPKTIYRRSGQGIFAWKSLAKRSRHSEWERIRQRANQMRADWTEQAA